MKALPDSCVDCVFADPPYNLQLRGQLHRPDETLVQGVHDDWDCFEGFAAYDAFCAAWLAEARRVLHPEGTMWVMGSYHNVFRVGTLMQDLGFWLLNDIVWRKTNPMPNFRGRRFTNAHETLIWAARQAGSPYRFNYQAMKSLNEGLQMRSDWFLPLCTGKERLRQGDGGRLHPTQKPESLLQRVLLASTLPGDIVLDPFGGTGTTAAAAKRMRRHYILMERNPTYAKAARQRLETVQPWQAGILNVTPERRQQPRVAFSHFVEGGQVPPGTMLQDATGRHQAMVTADGSLVAQATGQRGSIHQLGRALSGQASCNGWTFWRHEVAGQWQELDTLRQRPSPLAQTPKPES
ncbi:site-specific DNA-methyltransferase [Formicincola oecophyllae]|uniref:Methyltransferase n=1 Tax=Formicincola oecophyllae TaxID=2558361 RepID=A0A4Y6UD33_9PROT|nr:site-specific DNA-methyltransferase [Formicincola oecophyllae]QDH14291.1 site-specific DNA-methyltransferase [Formicincola oecophyllae]